MKAFITGGAGFIGRSVLRKLLERGYDVVALARSPESAALLESLGAQAVPGDITNRASLANAIHGSELLIHLAGRYRLGRRGSAIAAAINVDGTRNVLTVGHDLGVPRMIYTSTVAVFGDTGGRTVDESYHYRGPFLTEYDRTKWLAHYEMALPLIARGAPLIIVMPGGVYGPGDPNITGQLMRAFYQGRLRVLYGPETTLTYAYVDDVAEGHLLAAEKGEIGESYVLAGPPVPLGEMVRIWARLTGKPAPRLSIPTSLVRPVAPLAGLLERVLRVPEMYTAEAIRSLGVTYVARADRAREQLGWNSRPLEEGLRDTFHWIAESTALRGPALHRNRSLARLALLVAALVAISWYRCHARRPDRG